MQWLVAKMWESGWAWSQIVIPKIEHTKQLLCNICADMAQSSEKKRSQTLKKKENTNKIA